MFEWKKQEKLRNRGNEYFRLVAAALAFSGLVEAADFSYQKDEEGLSREQKEEILRSIHLPSSEALSDLAQVYVPRTSSEGKYIVHIPQQHAGYGLVKEDQNDREKTAAIQREIYEVLKRMHESFPLFFYYEEGISHGSQVKKETIRKIRSQIYNLIDQGSVDFNVQNIFEDASRAFSSEGFSRSVMHEIAFAIQDAFGKYSKDLEKRRGYERYLSAEEKDYLEKRNPYGEITRFYYGGGELAYQQGFIQEIRTAESREILERAAHSLEFSGSVSKELNQEREFFLIDTIKKEALQERNSFAVITLGGNHTLLDNLQSDPKNSNVGYIVVQPRSFK